MSFKSAPLLPGDVIQIFHNFFLPTIRTHLGHLKKEELSVHKKRGFACPSIQPILQTVERNPVFNTTKLVELGRKRECASPCCKVFIFEFLLQQPLRDLAFLTNNGNINHEQ